MPPRLNHVAIVVHNINEALEFYRDTLDLTLDHVAEEPAEQVRTAFLPTAQSKIELIQPTSADSGVAKFLAKRGEGLHHICVEVDDLEQTISEMKARDVEVIGLPQSNQQGEKYVFIHPKSAHGVLLELYERSTG